MLGAILARKGKARQLCTARQQVHSLSHERTANSGFVAGLDRSALSWHNVDSLSRNAGIAYRVQIALLLTVHAPTHG